MAHVPPPLKKYLLHPVQAVVAVSVYMFFRVLPLDWASGVGGFLARTIGPRLRISNRARRTVPTPQCSNRARRTVPTPQFSSGFKGAAHGSYTTIQQFNLQQFSS